MLDDRVSIPGRGWFFSLRHRVQTVFGVTQPPIQGLPSALSRGKAIMAWCLIKQWIRLYGVVLS